MDRPRKLASRGVTRWWARRCRCLGRGLEHVRRHLAPLQRIAELEPHEGARRVARGLVVEARLHVVRHVEPCLGDGRIDVQPS